MLGTWFSVVIKRENSIITKNGEYTYDCTLMLNNQVNMYLYGFLHRINKKGFVNTKRSAVLIADGHVYCRGTEVITGWTDKDVKIQIVSGNSELNYFIGASLKVEWLTGMGEIEGNLSQLWISANNPTSDDLDFALPAIMDSTNGTMYNQWILRGNDWPTLYAGSASRPEQTPLRAQPYLCALITKIIRALGYTIGENRLLETTFKNVFIVNTVNTKKFYEMLPGWTVKDFLEEVENLCNCVFLVDNVHRTCDIYLKSAYYQGTTAVPLRKVVDEYEAEIVDPEPEHSMSDLVYSFEDGDLQRLQDCEAMLGEMDIITCASFAEVQTALANVGVNDRKIAHDTSTDRYFIRISDPLTPQEASLANSVFIAEVNNFAPLRRDHAESEEGNEVEMGIVPVPMVHCSFYSNRYIEVPAVGMGSNMYSGGSFGGHRQEGDSEEEASEDGMTVEAFIKAGKNEEEKSKAQLYAAIYNGYHRERGGWMCSAFTDAYHAENIAGLRYMMEAQGFPWNYEEYNRYIDTYAGSLRFIDLDNEIYQGAYTIDTTKSVTFETFDRMVANPRQVLNIHNKLWVIREIEETITAMGRKPKWKVVCHPINIVATGEQVEWVLEDGTWNDGNPWYDHGRWLDEPEE